MNSLIKINFRIRIIVIYYYHIKHPTAKYIIWLTIRSMYFVIGAYSMTCYISFKYLFI